MAAPEGTQRRGLSRRDMIKASALAGAAAWTAPVIIDSLASPAAAVTGFVPPCGCHFVLFNGGTCNPDQQGTPCQIFTGCSGFTGLEACMQVAPASGTTKCQTGATVTNLCGPDCRISGGSAKAGNDCYFSTDGTGAIVLTSTGIVFNPAPNGNTYAQLAVFLTCPTC